MNEQFNMLVAGLTGQGTVMLTRVLATALLAEGHKVLATDVPAPTHRFSTTYSHIRWGSKVYAEAVPEGEADLVVGMEPAECLRVGLKFANEDTLVIMNDSPIFRMLFTPEVQTARGLIYPRLEEILGYFRRMGINKVKHFNATEVAANEAGNILTMNMVMLGAAFATGMIPAKAETIANCIVSLAPKKALDANLKAFQAGARKFSEIESRGDCLQGSPARKVLREG